MPSKEWVRRLGLVAVDATAWTVAVWTVVRVRADPSHVEGYRLFWFTLVVLCAAPAVGAAAHLYQGRCPIGGLEETVRLAWVWLTAGALGVVVDLAVPLVPRAVPLTAAFVALFLSWAVRGVIRCSRTDRGASPRDEPERSIPAGVAPVGNPVAGRRVLVTGAGRSVGSELCWQIDRLGPAELFLLDHDEQVLRAMLRSIRGEAVPVDIHDSENLRAVFARCAPDVVFHAEALDDPVVAELYPLEAWRTNVLGTYYVLEAALSAGVRTFVNVSAHEAADPVSILGRSRCVGERLTADAATRSGGAYLSVRLGSHFSTAVREAAVRAATVAGSGEALSFGAGDRPVRVPVPSLDPAHLLSLALGDNEIAAMTECATFPGDARVAS